MVGASLKYLYVISKVSKFPANDKGNGSGRSIAKHTKGLEAEVSLSKLLCMQREDF